MRPPLTTVPPSEAGAIFQFAEWQRYQGRFEEAAASYRQAIRKGLEESDDWPLLAESYRHRGSCLREIYLLGPADDAYQRGLAIARRTGDYAEELEILIARANLSVRRGERLAGRELLKDVIGRAEQLTLPVLTSKAYHELGLLAGEERQPEAALRCYWLAWRVAEGTAHPRWRLRSDIGWTLGIGGLHQAARDALWLVLLLANERELRWHAALNLLNLAIMDHHETSFYYYSRWLAHAPLPTRLRVSYHLHMAEGLRVFRRARSARQQLGHVRRLALQARLPASVLDDADRLERGLPLPSPAPLDPSTDVVRQVVEAMRVTGNVERLVELGRKAWRRAPRRRHDGR